MVKAGDQVRAGQQNQDMAQQLLTEASPAELIPTTLIFTTSTQEGDVYQPTQVQILPAPK